MITTKEIAQYALHIARQLEKLAPLERAEVMAVAGQLIQIEVQRALREPRPQLDLEAADE